MENIYHITHITNLQSIIKQGALYCDHKRIELGLNNQEIGYEHIKARRRKRPVPSAAGGTLADYVPFNFCPRSVMLFSIWKNKTAYQGGQLGVVHLEVSIEAAVALGKPWTFTNMHADLGIAEFFTDLRDRDQLRWDILDSRDWGGDERRPIKQAEFLLHQSLPWTAVSRIGVQTESVADLVHLALESAQHKPAVSVQPLWYYP